MPKLAPPQPRATPTRSLRDMLLLSDFARTNPRRADELLRRAAAKEPVDA